MPHYLSNGEPLRIGTQNFSGTDKSKNVESTGVVFPYNVAEKVEDGIVVSSILDHHENDERMLLKHTEARTVSGDGQTLTYKQMDTIAIVAFTEEQRNYSNALAELRDKPPSFIKYYYEASTDIDSFNLGLMVDELIEIYKTEESDILVYDKYLKEREYFSEYKPPKPKGKKNYLTYNEIYFDAW